MCGRLTVLGAPNMHDFGTDLIKNSMVWLAEDWNQIIQLAYCGIVFYILWKFLDAFDVKLM